MLSERLRLATCFLSVALLFLLPPSFAADDEYNLATSTVQVGVADLPLSFSPYADQALDLHYAHLFFDPLVRWGKEQQLEKRLLEKWQTLQPGLIRFYLKKNIYFHSGNQLSSADVSWTFAQILKSPQARRFFAGIKVVKPVDQYSFDIHSTLSEAQLLDYLTHFFVLDAKFYQGRQIDLNQAQAIISPQDKQLFISGSGPYKIKAYNAALSLNVISNKDYWQGEAALKELNFIKISSPDSRTFALLADDVAISEAVANHMLATVKLLSSKALVEVHSPNVYFLTVNEAGAAILKQKRVRDAINLAINKEGMLKHIINGMGRVVTLYTPIGQAEEESPVYDVAKAKTILSKVKLPAKFSLLILNDEKGNTVEVANALMNMLRRVGIKLAITQVTSKEEWNKNLHDYDFSLSAWHSSLLNSDNIYHDLFTDCVLSAYLSDKFKNAKALAEQAAFFEQMQQSHQIIPLLQQNKTWATDKQYNLPAIFSVNGIPYWHLLTVQ